MNPDIDALTGLTDEEARERLAEDGPNELPAAEKRSFGRILLSIVGEPMFLLLLACGGLYFLLGDREEAFLLLGFVLVVIVITYYQEQKTERALEAKWCRPDRRCSRSRWPGRTGWLIRWHA